MLKGVWLMPNERWLSCNTIKLESSVKVTKGWGRTAHEACIANMKATEDYLREQAPTSEKAAKRLKEYEAAKLEFGYDEEIT